MKTFCVVSKARQPAHAGEDYDDFIVVDDQPTTETIQEWAMRIMGRLRKLWHSDPTVGRKVTVTVDAGAPFAAVMLELQAMMAEQEGVIVELLGVEKPTGDGSEDESPMSEEPANG